VLKSGGAHIIRLYNLLINVANTNKGRLLAEPFSGLVAQGVILLLCQVFNALEICIWGLSTETSRIETVAL
jgi:hypothetical protein